MLHQRPRQLPQRWQQSLHDSVEPWTPAAEDTNRGRHRTSVHRLVQAPAPVRLQAVAPQEQHPEGIYKDAGRLAPPLPGTGGIRPQQVKGGVARHIYFCNPAPE